SWCGAARQSGWVRALSAQIQIVTAVGIADVLGQAHVERATSRIKAKVVSRIGFLGAGSILLSGEIVSGLTTAASLWSVAAVGLEVGGGLYAAAIAATVIIVVILAGIKPLERRYLTVLQRRHLVLLVERGTLTFDSLHAAHGVGSAHAKRRIVPPHQDGADGSDVNH
ncbi:MgtC/SapB family protein, partial [Burkholderia thailandensis]|uniref:MgtC/SapB family protein n=1 Tax=Burkholderia thailandensis TaxID=57975 RepID=UPI00217EE427